MVSTLNINNIQNINVLKIDSFIQYVKSKIYNIKINTDYFNDYYNY